MEVETYTHDKHYLEYKSWWTKRGQPAPPQDILPNLGAVIFEDDKPLAASFAYLSNSKLAQIAFTATNPEVSARQRVRGAYLSIIEMEKTLSACNYKYVHSFSDQSTITKLFKNAGFVTRPSHEFLLKRLGE